jgi:glutamine amidotransferase-like uncharacterized protein
MPTRFALLYADAGADPFCTACLEAALSAHFTVRRVMADEIVAGGRWQDGTDLLAFPGGADRPFADKLDGAGNTSIRRYVEQGGRFLGVCAGAYYACRRIDFTGADLRVKAPRELGLFPGTAVGSLPELADAYRMGDLACSAVVDVVGASTSAGVLYWGGCRFEPDPPAAVEPLLEFARLPGAAAAVACDVDEGRVVLTGVHAEVDGDAFDRERRNYPGAAEHAFKARRLRLEDSRRAAVFDRLITALRFD